MEYRPLLMEYRPLLMEYKALFDMSPSPPSSYCTTHSFWKCALSSCALAYRALLTEYTFLFDTTYASFGLVNIPQGLLLYDLLFFWVHLALHKVPSLRFVKHRQHHCEFVFWNPPPPFPWLYLVLQGGEDPQDASSL